MQTGTAHIRSLTGEQTRAVSNQFLLNQASIYSMYAADVFVNPLPIYPQSRQENYRFSIHFNRGCSQAHGRIVIDVLFIWRDVTNPIMGA